MQLVHQIQQATQKLLHSFKLGNVVKNGVQVAIIGKPNAGKSTLLNALLNEDRAIVSDIAGTTRDTIEEILNIQGVLFRLIDTAGIRQHTTDDIETIGVGKSLQKAAQADIILYLYDATNNESITEEKQWLIGLNKPFILVANKADKLENKTELEAVYISAKENTNIDLLKKMLLEKTVSGEIDTEATIITNTRHQEALQKLSISLQEVQKGIKENLPGDLLALDIRHCLHFLGNITGEITNEDQLDFIFSKFCIGK
jgi:tRNA modification GTPase